MLATEIKIGALLGWRIPEVEDLRLRKQWGSGSGKKLREDQEWLSS